MVKEQKKEKEPKDTLAEQISKEKDYYLESSRQRRGTWEKCWKAYNSFIDNTKNPFLANLFIPKTHEAVELLAAFLSGPNQSIQVEPEGKEDTKKARIVEKFLEFQWRKILKARSKIITWIKQSILFGNGVIKVGWNEEKKEAYMEPVSLNDIYFDYYYRDLQDSPSVIHEIIKKVKDIKKDKSYDDKRKQIISTLEMTSSSEKERFSAYDDTVIMEPAEDETILLERWTLDKVITIAPTSLGWQVIREIDNPYKDSSGKKFIPFVKIRLKINPLPNRAYDIGAIEPTIKIQQAFNDMMNEIFDNVSLINNKGWIKRRGANINPMDLVRRPGFTITVDNIDEDIKSESVSDIKPSAMKVLELLDNEFQQASMVINLLKGVPGAEFATEAAIGQSNVMTLLDIVDQNIKEALSELGQMILEINLAHIDKVQSVKVLDTDNETLWMEVQPKDIKGKYDIKISADRSATYSKVIRQKQLLDFLNIISSDEGMMEKYPEMKEKIYKKWLEEAGFGDLDYFFEGSMSGLRLGGLETARVPKRPELPARGQGLTVPGIARSVETSLNQGQGL